MEHLMALCDNCTHAMWLPPHSRCAIRLRSSLAERHSSTVTGMC
jgi:hypothetical protein